MPDSPTIAVETTESSLQSCFNSMVRLSPIAAAATESTGSAMKDGSQPSAAAPYETSAANEAGSPSTGTG